jgi:hypothetical protein
VAERKSGPTNVERPRVWASFDGQKPTNPGAPADAEAGLDSRFFELSRVAGRAPDRQEQTWDNARTAAQYGLMWHAQSRAEADQLATKLLGVTGVTVDVQA